MKPTASVILATYNQPRVLDLALWGYSRQTTRDFEIVIADDGSKGDTAVVIQEHASRLPVPLGHVWQEDDGFRKARACNRAVLASTGSHLIFSDGDCIPSASFVQEHLAARRADAYIVGGYVRLGPVLSEEITRERVLAGWVERQVTWRQAADLWRTHAKSLVYIALRKRRKPRLLGLNYSLPRECFYRVNGLDMTYENASKDDSDLRNRLQLAGARAVSLWHRARVFHLHNPVPTYSRVGWEGRHAYYDRPDLVPWAPLGLQELELELAAQRSPTPS